MRAIRMAVLSLALISLTVSESLAFTFPEGTIDNSGPSLSLFLLILLLVFIGGIVFVVSLFMRVGKSGGKGLADFMATGWIGKEGMGLFRSRVARGQTGESNSLSETRECPYCAEVIKRKAKICRFCNREIE